MNYTSGIESGEFFELEVWRRFRKVHYRSNANQDSPAHPGLKHCVVPQTVFTAESPHGTHLCFVTELFGSMLDELQVGQPGFTFPLHVVKRAVRQTLLALDFLHTELKLVHAGASCVLYVALLVLGIERKLIKRYTDVKSGNLLINLDATTEDVARYLQNHPAETYPSRSVPELWSGPIITVKSQPLPNLGLKPSLENLNVALGDFGGGR